MGLTARTRATVRFLAFPDDPPVTATVYSRGHDVRPGGGRLYDVVFEADNPIRNRQRKYRAGMNVELTISVRTYAQVVVVPV